MSRLYECIVLRANHNSDVSVVSIYIYDLNKIVNTILFNTGFNYDKEHGIFQGRTVYINFYHNTDVIHRIYDSDNDKAYLLYDM